MKTITTFLLLLLVSVAYALPSAGTEIEGLGPMTAFFIAFGILIVFSQFIPGLRLFAEMLRKIFLSTDRKVTDTSRNK